MRISEEIFDAEYEKYFKQLQLLTTNINAKTDWYIEYEKQRKKLTKLFVEKCFVKIKG